MFQRREHARRLHSLDVRRSEPADERRVLAKRSRVDDRIARVVVDVDDGGEVDVHADRPRLLSGDTARLARQPLVARRPERHQPREGGRPRDAEADAPLEVRGVEEGHLRDRLQAVEDGCRGHRLAERHRAVGRVQQHARRQLGRAEHVEAPDVVLVHGLHERVVPFGIGAQETGLEGGDDHLPDLLFQGHLLQRRPHPLFRGPVEHPALGRRREHGCDGPGGTGQYQREAARHVEDRTPTRAGGHGALREGTEGDQLRGRGGHGGGTTQRPGRPRRDQLRGRGGHGGLIHEGFLRDLCGL